MAAPYLSRLWQAGLEAGGLCPFCFAETCWLRMSRSQVLKAQQVPWIQLKGRPPWAQQLQPPLLAPLRLPLLLLPALPQIARAVTRARSAANGSSQRIRCSADLVLVTALALGGSAGSSSGGGRSGASSSSCSCCSSQAAATRAGWVACFPTTMHFRLPCFSFRLSRANMLLLQHNDYRLSRVAWCVQVQFITAVRQQPPQNDLCTCYG